MVSRTSIRMSSTCATNLGLRKKSPLAMVCGGRPLEERTTRAVRVRRDGQVEHALRRPVERQRAALDVDLVGAAARVKFQRRAARRPADRGLDVPVSAVVSITRPRRVCGPRRGRGVAAIRVRGLSASRPRRRRDSSEDCLCPRRVYGLRRRRGVAATRVRGLPTSRPRASAAIHLIRPANAPRPSI